MKDTLAIASEADIISQLDLSSINVLDSLQLKDLAPVESE